MSQLAIFTEIFLLQSQVLTPSAMESIAKSGNSLLIQAPVLVAGLIGLVLAVLRFKGNRLVSILTIAASLLLIGSSVVSPLVSVWLPFFTAPTPQALPDGTISPSPVEVLQNNLFYAALINSFIVAVALLIYLGAIFAGRKTAVSKIAAVNPALKDL